jgi:hypothetical protein
MLSVIMLYVIMLNVVILNVAMLSVMAPFQRSGSSGCECQPQNKEQ